MTEPGKEDTNGSTAEKKGDVFLNPGEDTTFIVFPDTLSMEFPNHTLWKRNKDKITNLLSQCQHKRYSVDQMHATAVDYISKLASKKKQTAKRDEMAHLITDVDLESPAMKKHLMCYAEEKQVATLKQMQVTHLYLIAIKKSEEEAILQMMLS